MKTVKIAITLQPNLLSRLDQLVKARRFPNRSQAIQEAIREKLERLAQSRLAQECSRLDRRQEQALAEEGLGKDLEQWPAY
jgi:metal-responsive CopG/Arc/MetJ family transcriptional regulator